ncbi:MAG: hypothetical protein IJD13_01250 [Oscillospiraceae bacterium]|nr:hypothetical protein [Oscillospiraceae bacterium]
MESLNILELAVIYSALDERIERLKALRSDEVDLMLAGEIKISESLLKKAKTLYLSKGGPASQVN